jgi:hypothetical protein
MSVNRAAKKGVGKIIGWHIRPENFTTAIVVRERCPTVRWLADFVAGTNQKFRSARLIRHAKKVVGHVVAVVSCPNARANSDGRHQIVTFDRFDMLLKSGHKKFIQNKTD